MRHTAFDCVVLDLRLPDMSGFDLLAQVQKDPKLRETPIIVFTGRELSEQEESELRKKAKSIVLKGVRSPERLLDETALFLHRVIGDLPQSKQQMIETLHESDEPLTGRKVLVVDDDIRNIFALNSLLGASQHAGDHGHQRPGGDQPGREHGRPVARARWTS